MYIFLIVLGIILLLLGSLMFLRASVIIEADEGARVYLKILFFKLRLYPKEKKRIRLKDYSTKRFKRLAEKEKKKSESKQKKKASKQAKKQKKTSAQDGKKEKMTLSDITDIVLLVRKLAQTFFAKFGKHLHLDITRVHVTVAGEDPASTAIFYGIVCQSVAYLVELLDNITNLCPKEDKDIAVNADFFATKPSVNIKLAASMRVWQAIDIAFSIAYKFVKERFLKQANNK